MIFAGWPMLGRIYLMSERERCDRVMLVSRREASINAVGRVHASDAPTRSTRLSSVIVARRLSLVGGAVRGAQLSLGFADDADQPRARHHRAVPRGSPWADARADRRA